MKSQDSCSSVMETTSLRIGDVRGAVLMHKEIQFGNLNERSHKAI